MGDAGDDYRAMKEARKEEKAMTRDTNNKLLDADPVIRMFPVEQTADRRTYRLDFITVDFYPSTSKWRVRGVERTYYGDAKRFCEWVLAHRHSRVVEGKLARGDR